MRKENYIPFRKVNEMITDHIGYAVYEIEKSIIDFEFIGYEIIGDRVIDEQRNLIFQFMTNGLQRIELVQTLDEEKNSPIKTILKKNGNVATPYHMCFVTDKWEQSVDNLKLNRYLKISEVSEDKSVTGARSAFFVKGTVGMIELWEANK